MSVKLVITGFLFFSYPTPAHLSLIISENIIALLNQSRTEAGFEPLVEDKILSGFAGQKASDMITRDYFSHDTPEGKRPWQWINRGEYDYIYAGENLAMDFITAESVHEAFMKSPSHRRNILNPKYKNVGIAVISGKLGGKDTTLLVQFFGARREDLGTLAKTQKLPLESAGESNIASQENPPASLPAPESLTVGSSNEGVIIVAAAQKTSKTLINALMEYSNVFFIAFLLFVLIAFLLNVFIKIKIQDASVILQSVAAIALLLSLVLVKFHFIEKIASQILIL
ncbi:hypothetical protein HYZ76_00020 [Candidatus Falkowbacteria bacterium]|nr:hypothetical protein [Candidatus Falkowbacteria bacterium]